MDLDAVDQLCRAVLAARRLGCGLRLVDPDPALVELLVLSGLADLFSGLDPSSQPDGADDGGGDVGWGR